MNQQRGGQRQMTENQQISHQQKQQQALNQLMSDVRAKRRDIEAVLPADIRFEKFQACLNMAIRREPKLLECHGPSLIRAAIMSAYDGLLPDGKEAVIVYRAMSYKEPSGQWAKTKRLEASYMPMTFGLRKKIVEAGAARHIKAVCVYQNDHFVWEEGLEERLEHKPFLADEADVGEEDPRGPLRAVYSIAILPDGDKVFEVMPRREVMKVKAKAQTKDVWEGPFEAEMWRKSVLRRHSKALPSSTPIRDAEAQVMFPQFGGQQPGPLDQALPAPSRPTREQFAQLGAPDVELPLDLSGFGGDGVLEEERVEPSAEKPAATKRKAATKGKPDEAADDARPEAEPADQGSGEDGATGDQGRPDPAEQPLPRPATDAQWGEWQTKLLAEVGRTTRVDRLDEIHQRERENIQAAPQRMRNRVEGSFSDMRVDLAERSDD